MTSFTDPTNPIGGGGSGGAGANTIGGFFQMGEVDGIGSGYGSNSYNPGAVQEAILQLLAACGPHMTEFQVEDLMWLMQEYGNQDIGVDATNQTSMNQYFGDVQHLWGVLYSANVPASALPQLSTQLPTYIFDNIVASMSDGLARNPFFNESPEGKQMLGELTGTLNAIEELVGDPATTPAQDPLYEMWQAYNGGDSGGTVATSGTPNVMDQMMRELGQLNQDVTGVSQSIGTQFQSDSNNQQSESGALNNYLQMLYKMGQVFVQNMQSAG